MFSALIPGYRFLYLQLAALVGCGWAIVALSFICSFLMLPLMRAVAGIVRREKEYEDVIDPQVAAIKAKYASDMDCHFHIQTLYQRYGYSPLAPIKKVLPLFVQIPFLLLTYYMLKGTVQLSGVSFLFLRDLGAADALLPHAVNLLPLVMTGVNILTVFATPGFSHKDWTQAIAISLLFLVLLYMAPSALLLYWTLNNVITMFRTLFSNKGEGTRILAIRICAIRHLPSQVNAWLTVERLTWLSLGLFLTSVYMWLMVFMEVWFFNCFVSKFFMAPVLALAFSASLAARYKQLGKWTMIGRLSVGFLTSLSVIMGLAAGAMVVAPGVTAALGRHVSYSKTFYVLLAIWFVWALVGNLRKGFCRQLFMALKSESHWLFLPVILGLHYSFSSDLVKLPVDSVCVLALELVGPCVAMLLIVVIMFCRHLAMGKLMRAAVGFCVGAYLIPMISFESGKLLGWSSNLVIRLAVIFALIVFMCRLNRRKPVVAFLLVLLMLAAGNALLNGQNAADVKDRKLQIAESEAAKAFCAARAVRHNSIYLLVYDSYTPDAVLEHLCITNSRIKDILLKRGFTRYDSYSVGSDTVKSMGYSFAIGDVKQGSVRSMMAGNNPLCDFLRRSGYRTSYALGAYDMPNRGECMPGDFYFPSPQAVTRLEHVLYPCILKGFLSQSPNNFNPYTEDEWYGIQKKLLVETPATNNFVYTHEFCPGHAIASPVYRKSQAEEIQAYSKRIEKADRNIERDVDFILAKNDDSIIIVAGDHGSCLEMCPVGDFGRYELLDRCGNQLFIRWPKGYEPTLSTCCCFTDAFLEIVICLTGDRSLTRFITAGESLPILYPLKAPQGAIKRGVIQMGRDKGKSLY